MTCLYAHANHGPCHPHLLREESPHLFHGLGTCRSRATVSVGLYLDAIASIVHRAPKLYWHTPAFKTTKLDTPNYVRVDILTLDLVKVDFLAQVEPKGKKWLKLQEPKVCMNEYRHSSWSGGDMGSQSWPRLSPERATQSNSVLLAAGE